VLLHLRWPGPNEMPATCRCGKGQELGWFEHGSTIIVFAPPGLRWHRASHTGQRIRMGQACCVCQRIAAKA
jgi:phosphatidylserine decarboxylase